MGPFLDFRALAYAERPQHCALVLMVFNHFQNIFEKSQNLADFWSKMTDFRDFRAVFFRYAVLNGKSIFFQENGPYDLKFATDIPLGICNND